MSKLRKLTGRLAPGVAGADALADRVLESGFYVRTELQVSWKYIRFE